MSDEKSHRSLLVIFTNWANQPRIRIVHRSYVARNSPTPGAIYDIENLNLSFILLFPDTIDRKLLSLLMILSPQVLPDPISPDQIPSSLLIDFIDRGRAYFAPARKRASLKKLSGASLIDSSPKLSFDWRIIGRDIAIVKNEITASSSDIINPTFVISRTENGRFVGFPFVHIFNRDRRAPLYLLNYNVSKTFFDQISEVAESHDLILWSFPDDMVSLISSVELLIDKGWSFINASGIKIIKSSFWHMKASEKSNWFEIDGDSNYGTAILPFSEMLSSLKKQEPFVKLPTGEIGILPSVWANSLIPILPYLNNESNISISFTGLMQLPIFSVFDKKTHFVKTEILLSAQKNIQQIEWSGSYLKPYQNSAVHWMSAANRLNVGCVLADEMGLGKTIVALAHLSFFDGPHLIVVPASLISNWIHEINNNLPEHKHAIWESTLSENNYLGTDIIIISYQMMLRHIDEISKRRYGIAIFDESQYLKNPFSLTAKAARKINFHQAITLTGTPIENNTTELWSHLNLVAPKWFYNRKEFETICNYAISDDGSLNNLKTALSPFILRRTRTQVLTELPDLTIEIIRCDMYDDHQKLYQQWVASARMAFFDEAYRTRKKGAVLEALLRLRQICCDPYLINKTTKQENIIPSGKSEALISKIIEISEYDKVIVFSQFSSYLIFLQSLLKKCGKRSLLMIGNTRNRDEILTCFKKTDNENILLSSLKVGGIGLNITEASYVLLCDPWWNPAAEMQAWSRAYRIGQKKNVTVLKFVCANTIEERILELQEKKESLNRLIPSKLSDEELLKMLL